MIPEIHDPRIAHITRLMNELNVALEHAADHGLDLVVSLLPMRCEGDYHHEFCQQIRIKQIIELA